MKKSYKGLAVILSLLFLNSTSSGDELPVEARRLVDQRDEAIKRINEKFAQELEKVKVIYTKRGDLEKANAIVALLAKAKPSNTLQAADFSGVWIRSAGGKTTLHQNGQVSTDWSGSPRKWRKISKNSIGITHNGKEIVWTLKADAKTLQNRLGSITMTRKK